MINKDGWWWRFITDPFCSCHRSAAKYLETRIIRIF
jgi:hypothetical protein